MATLVLLGAVYQNSFVTDPIGNPLIITTPELANFASKSAMTNYVISAVNPLTNLDTRTVVMSNQWTFASGAKVKILRQLESATNYLSHNTLTNWDTFSPSGGAVVSMTNYFADYMMWFRNTDKTKNRAIMMGEDPTAGSQVANILWNPTHDDPSGVFGGELQTTAPSISFGMNGSGTPGSVYHVGRRLQIGIGDNYLQWVDIHFDSLGNSGAFPGFTLPLRFQVQQGNVSAVCYPTLFGYNEDLTGGVGHATLGFYDDFDTLATNNGSYWQYSGMTNSPTIRGKMKTGRGWDFYGAVTATNITTTSLTNNGVGGTKVVITDANGKEVGATLSGLTLVGTTLTASGTGSQTPWTSDINGAGFALTNVGSMIITGELDVASLRVTNADSSIWIASSAGSGTNITIHTNLTVVGLGSALSPQLVLTNGAASANIHLYSGVAGSTPSGIYGGSKGLVFTGTNGIFDINLEFTNGTAWFPSNVVAWSFHSTSNSTVGLSALDANQLSISNTVSGNLLTLTNGGATFSSNVVAANFYGNGSALTMKLLTNAIGATFVSGSALTPGSVAQIPIPYDCTLIDLQMIAYPAGAAVLDLKDCTISGTTMTVGSSIVNGGTAPTITATANAYADTSLTSWTTGLTAGHSLQCSVTSCTIITNLTLTMRVTHAQ